MDRIKVIVVDDESHARDAIATLLEEFGDIDLCHSAANALEGLKAAIMCKPDIAFLDVEMPGGDGLSLARQIGDLGLDTRIVFCTAYEHYAIEAIRRSAFDYLVKPVTTDELKTTVDRFRQLPKGRRGGNIEQLIGWISTPKVSFRTRTGTLFIDPSEVIWMEAEGNYTELKLTGGRHHMISQYLAEALESMPEGQFFRVSRSAVINLRFLEQVDRKKKVCLLKDEGDPIMVKGVHKNLRSLEDLTSSK